MYLFILIYQLRGSLFHLNNQFGTANITQRKGYFQYLRGNKNV